MISIIVSSYRAPYFDALEENIRHTIGDVRFEIIKVWNPNIMSISEAYNKGAMESQYEILLFLHEDVAFLECNWGAILLESLKGAGEGICGLAGSRKQFALPIGYETGFKANRHVYVKHSVDEEVSYKQECKTCKVKSLDGVFLAMHKTLWLDYKFNEAIKGFHFYDLDISLRVSEHYQNYVLTNIKLHHFSRGQFNDSWVLEAIKFYKQPYNFDTVTPKELNYTRNYWYERLKKERITIFNRIRYVYSMGINRPTRKAAIQFIFFYFWRTSTDKLK